MEKLREKIIDILKTIYDPEIPVSIWDLGLIYNIDIINDNEILITMTLTAPNCPVADSLPDTVCKKVSSIPEISKVDIKLSFEPPWNIDLMSDEAKLDLGFL